MVEKDDGKRSGPSASAIERAERVAPTPGGWTVQVGSFGVRATSDRLAADLKREGFTAFIVAFQSSGNTLYRVRVGPARDRATAEVLLRRVKALHPAATLVAPS